MTYPRKRAYRQVLSDGSPPGSASSSVSRCSFAPFSVDSPPTATPTVLIDVIVEALEEGSSITSRAQELVC